MYPETPIPVPKRSAWLSKPYANEHPQEHEWYVVYIGTHEKIEHRQFLQHNIVL